MSSRERAKSGWQVERKKDLTAYMNIRKALECIASGTSMTEDEVLANKERLQELRNKIVRELKPFFIGFMQKRGYSSEEHPDLLQDMALATMETLDDYDASRGELTTFLSFPLQDALHNYIKHQRHRGLGMGLKTYHDHRRLETIRAKNNNKFQDKRSTPELVDELAGANESRRNDYRRAANIPPIADLEDMTNDEGIHYWEELIADENRHQDNEVIGKTADRVKEIARTILNARTLEIIDLVIAGLTYEEIGKRYGVTKQAAYANYKRGIDRIRKELGFASHNDATR